MHFSQTGKIFFHQEAREGHFFTSLSAFHMVVYISVRAARVRAYTRAFCRTYLGVTSEYLRRIIVKKFYNCKFRGREAATNYSCNC